MAKVSFKVGDEVTVLDGRNCPYRITRIVRPGPDGWCTESSRIDANSWSKTGLVRDNRFSHQRIVLTTDEHRREIRARGLRQRLALAETWKSVAPETIEYVAKLISLA